MFAPGPPLQPSGDEGRRLLRDELVHGEYHRRDLLRRLLGWLWRRLEGGVGAASGTDWLKTLVTMLVGALLLVGLVLLLSRVRRDRRRREHAPAVLTGARTSADELRRRAESALADGRHTDAVVDAFRALAVRQVEQGRLADQPGTTAHEVAATLATAYPHHGERVGRGADLFDATFYGDRPASRADAATLLELDDDLAGVR
jgi:Domain of unknown function (DUF4129)